MTRKCVQCNRTFELTEDEIKFYKDKGYSLPKRCENCRRLNRSKRGTPDRFNGSRNNNRLYVCCAVVIAFILIMAAGGSFLVQNFKDSSAGENAAVGVYAGEINAGGAYKETADFGQSAPAQGILGNGGTESPSAPILETYKYRFRKEQYLQEHFQKHGAEFGYETAEEYLAGANSVILAEDSLHKTEKEDGDDVYYRQSANAIVFVSADGYIRTYFMPEDGIDYYNRQ